MKLIDCKCVGDLGRIFKTNSKQLLMYDTTKIVQKLNSVGVQSDRAQVLAEVITAVVQDALENVPTREYVDTRLDEQDAKNGQMHAETQTISEKQRAENAEVHSQTQTEFARQDVKNAEIDTAMKTGFARQDVNNAKLRTEMSEGFGELGTKIEKRFGEQDVKIEKRFGEQDVKIEKKFGDLHRENAELHAKIDKAQLVTTRWIIGTFISLGGLIITLGALILSN